MAAAAWINASTYVGAPVSTMHAIIGGIIGATVAAAGLNAIAWPMVGIITVSWTISPLLGGLFAATLHAVIRVAITRRHDKIGAARFWVPILVAGMAGIFAMYFTAKATGRFWHPSLAQVLLIGFVFAALGWLLAMPWVRVRSLVLKNRKKQVARLFRPPLIIAAALLSFAHGANDVANAVAPLAVIVAAATSLEALPLPFWTLAIGAVGIALGIALFGPRIIHTIGEQITKLNEIRAFCVALSAATTLLAASALGLPISSTHVTVGAVFGVGFLREYLAIRNMHGAAVPVEARFALTSMLNATPQDALARERRNERRYLVRRLKVARIAAAWVITLPASAGIAAAVYLGLAHFIA